MATIERIAAGCRAAGVPFGTDADEPQWLAGLGACFFATGIDTGFLANGARTAMAGMKAALGTGGCGGR